MNEKHNNEIIPEAMRREFDPSLPVHYLGREPRFYCAGVTQWVLDETRADEVNAGRVKRWFIVQVQ
jgi:hypothetical protein